MQPVRIPVDACLLDPEQLARIRGTCVANKAEVDDMTSVITSRTKYLTCEAASEIWKKKGTTLWWLVSKRYPQTVATAAFHRTYRSYQAYLTELRRLAGMLEFTGNALNDLASESLRIDTEMAFCRETERKLVTRISMIHRILRLLELSRGWD